MTARIAELPRRAFAHSLEGRPHSEWERLESHLDEVARTTAQFTAQFGFRTHGGLVGLWHDLGKYSAEFQNRIRADSDASIERVARVDHSTFGAKHSYESLGPLGWLLAYCIAGHHAGLANALTPGALTSLEQRLDKREVPSVPARSASVDPPPDRILRPPASAQIALNAEIRSLVYDQRDPRRAFQLAFLTRMVFSALVDADSICTERFREPDRAATRMPTAVTLKALAERLRVHLDALSSDDTEVNRARGTVLGYCRSKAGAATGLFSLTVPTGGGKTLSSLAFALEHAVAHGLCRVVYAIPFTSIVEQNARVIRDVLERSGERVVLEHHCNLTPERETLWSNRAAENWDAPVVVTTNVQLFDSLFANSRSRCRRLHRLARSVIVLDEAQALPVNVLLPCLAAIEELVRNYACTVVICTATQPAIVRRPEFSIGLESPREIVEDVESLFAALQRTEVKIVEQRSDEALVERLLEERQALCIVNTRKHAAELFAALRSSDPCGAFHLSALMCAAHRSEVLGRIRAALDAGQQCRLVSTQVIEAGVDVDFPVVLRAMAGFDAIAQAAGRCNREGRLDRGMVEVFETDQRPSPAVKSAAEDARELLRDHADDLLSPAAIHAYFALRYWQRESEWDKGEVLRCFQMDHGGKRPFLADFHDAAARFRMIDDAQVSVVVPYSDGAALLDLLLRVDRPDRELLRRLQGYTVGVYEGQLRSMLERRVVFEHPDVEALYLLAKKDAYDIDLGLLGGAASGADAMIV